MQFSGEKPAISFLTDLASDVSSYSCESESEGIKATCKLVDLDLELNLLQSSRLDCGYQRQHLE